MQVDRVQLALEVARQQVGKNRLVSLAPTTATLRGENSGVR